MRDSHSDSDSSVDPGAQRRSMVALRVAYLVLAAVLVALIYLGYQAICVKSSLSESQQRTMTGLGVTTATTRHLATRYSDVHGRLMADAPSDPKELLDPDTLVLAYGEDTDLDVQPVDWEDFQKHLAETTGKKVIAQEYSHAASDVAAIVDGQIHVVALHAADAPFLVNNAGFIPIAVVGRDGGAVGNHL